MTIVVGKLPKLQARLPAFPFPGYARQSAPCRLLMLLLGLPAALAGGWILFLTASWTDLFSQLEYGPLGAIPLMGLLGLGFNLLLSAWGFFRRADRLAIRHLSSAVVVILLCYGLPTLRARWGAPQEIEEDLVAFGLLFSAAAVAYAALFYGLTRMLIAPPEPKAADHDSRPDSSSSASSSLE